MFFFYLWATLPEINILYLISYISYYNAHIVFWTRDSFLLSKRDSHVCLFREVYQVLLNAVHNQTPYGCLGRLQPRFCPYPALWMPSQLEL